MSVPQLPLAEVTRRAVEVLNRELGPANAARFLAQFDSWSGDYTADRVALFDGHTVMTLAADIRAAVAGPGHATPPTRNGSPESL